MSATSTQSGLDLAKATCRARVDEAITRFMRCVALKRDTRSAQPARAHSSGTQACGAGATSPPPSPQAAEPVLERHPSCPPFAGPWVSDPTPHVPAPDDPLAMDAKHPLVTRLVASLPATSPRDGLALPNAQLVARRALNNSSRRARCWTTTVFPPHIKHDAACEASHLTLVPMPTPAAGDKGAGNRGAKGKFKAKAKGKDRVRLPRGQFAIERDVVLGWALPRPLDVNAVLGLSGGALSEAEADRVFVLAALALAHHFDHPAHLTLWGSTTAVMTSRRIQRFLEGTPTLPVKLPIAWLGVANMLWCIQGQHVQRFASDMPYVNAASLADAEADAPAPSLPTTTAPSTRVTRNAARPAAPAIPDTPTPPVDAPPRRPPAPTHWEDAPNLDTSAFQDWAYTAKEDRADLDADLGKMRRLIADAAAGETADANASPLSQCSSLPSSLSSLSSSSSTPAAGGSLSGETFVTSGSEPATSRGTSVDTCVSDAAVPAKGKASGGAKRKRVDEPGDIQETVPTKRVRRPAAPKPANAGSRPARRMPFRRGARRS